MRQSCRGRGHDNRDTIFATSVSNESLYLLSLTREILLTVLLTCLCICVQYLHEIVITNVMVGADYLEHTWISTLQDIFVIITHTKDLCRSWFYLLIYLIC